MLQDLDTGGVTIGILETLCIISFAFRINIVATLYKEEGGPRREIFLEVILSMIINLTYKNLI